MLLITFHVRLVFEVTCGSMYDYFWLVALQLPTVQPVFQATMQAALQATLPAALQAALPAALQAVLPAALHVALAELYIMAAQVSPGFFIYILLL